MLSAQLADSLAAAHAQGIVHRELSPPVLTAVKIQGWPRGKGLGRMKWARSLDVADMAGISRMLDAMGVQIRNSTAEFLIFTSQAGEGGIEVRVEDETVWLTQKLIAVLFAVDIRTVSEHLGNIYSSGELQENATLRKFRTVQTVGLGGRVLLTRHRAPDRYPLAASSAAAVQNPSVGTAQLPEQGESPGPERTPPRPPLGKAIWPGEMGGAAEKADAAKAVAPQGDALSDAVRPHKADKLQSKPRGAVALVQQGRAKLNDGEPEAAAALFALAIRLDARRADAVGGLGQANFEQGNFEDAARYLGVAIQLAPRRNAAYQELLAQVLYKMGRIEEAAEASRELLKLVPGSAKAKQTLELAERKLRVGSTTASPSTVEPRSLQLRRPAAWATTANASQPTGTATEGGNHAGAPAKHLKN